MEQESMCVNSTAMKDPLLMELKMEEELWSILGVVKFNKGFGPKINL